MPLKLSKTFIEWEQECADLLFIPIAGDAVGKGEELGKLPYGLLCVTRLKRNNSLTGSLDAFETWISRICSTTGWQRQRVSAASVALGVKQLII